MALESLILRQSDNANHGSQRGIAAITDAAPDAKISSFRLAAGRRHAADLRGSQAFCESLVHTQMGTFRPPALEAALQVFPL